jgi:galactokinase
MIFVNQAPAALDLRSVELAKMTIVELAQRFEREFHAHPKVFSAPARVNLIGEHTDYNDGFVLPAAIAFYIRIAISPRNDQKLILCSTEFPENFDFDMGSPPQHKLGAWCDYVLGVALALTRAGCELGGANLLVHGEVPIGAGLSSSAALEVASALALLSLSKANLSLRSIAKLCQSAENEFVGAHVGTMDQFVSCFGKQGHALLLDCRSLDFELVPLPEEVKLVICNTLVKHQLSEGEYNRRREECEQGVHILSRFYSGIKALRDVTEEQLAANAAALPPVIYKRCLHVLEENARVMEAVRSFRAGDLPRVGSLMHDSHRSLRDLYEVSCRELDIMVESAQGLPGYYGGRMTGGGFGGCTVNLVESHQTESFAQQVAERYRQKTGISPDVYICSPADGAGAALRPEITPVFLKRPI